MTAARWAASWAIAYSVLHHLGALPDGLGAAPQSTRWVDWLDLLTPYAVVGTALAALATAGTDRRGWWTALIGAGAYVQGHGVHLAANSISNVRGDAPPIHLWDEVIGHWLWYAGLALLVAALARAVELRLGVASAVLAGGVGLTWTTNALEGTTAVASLGVALGLAGWGTRRRNGTGLLLVVAFGLSALLLVGYGIWHGGFPRSEQPVTVPRLLAASAVAMVLTHWLRLLPLGYAAPGETRWEDFVDLLTPYVVAGPALAVLARTGAGRRTWGLALLGAAVFTSGQGLHLSANAISFTSGPTDPAYLWDEQVGHHLWFGGLTLLLIVVVRTVERLPLPSGPGPDALAVLVAVTWAANVVEGGTVPFGVAIALGLTAYGWRTRARPTGRLLAIAFGLSLVLVAVYGVQQGGFPQPSELGWL